MPSNCMFRRREPAASETMLSTVATSDTVAAGSSAATLRRTALTMTAGSPLRVFTTSVAARCGKWYADQ